MRHHVERYQIHESKDSDSNIFKSDSNDFVCDFKQIELFDSDLKED